MNARFSKAEVTWEQHRTEQDIRLTEVEETRQEVSNRVQVAEDHLLKTDQRLNLFQQNHDHLSRRVDQAQQSVTSSTEKISMLQTKQSDLQRIHDEGRQIFGEIREEIEKLQNHSNKTQTDLYLLELQQRKNYTNTTTAINLLFKLMDNVQKQQAFQVCIETFETFYMYFCNYFFI